MEPEVPKGNEQMELRLQKLKKMREQGLNPFGERFERTNLLQDITDRFSELENQTVIIAGRLISKRDGKRPIELRDVDYIKLLQDLQFEPRVVKLA